MKKILLTTGKMGPWSRILITYLHSSSGTSYTTTMQDSGRLVRREEAANG